jgi:hypothetical protein
VTKRERTRGDVPALICPTFLIARELVLGWERVLDLMFVIPQKERASDVTGSDRDSRGLRVSRKKPCPKTLEAF